jgi:hypothetical protein
MKQYAKLGLIWQRKMQANVRVKWATSAPDHWKLVGTKDKQNKVEYYTFAARPLIR